MEVSSACSARTLNGDTLLLLLFSHSLISIIYDQASPLDTHVCPSGKHSRSRGTPPRRDYPLTRSSPSFLITEQLFVLPCPRVILRPFEQVVLLVDTLWRILPPSLALDTLSLS